MSRITHLSRRDFLRTSAAACAAAAGASTLIAPRRAWATVQAAPIRSIEAGARGITVTFDFAHGMFPAPGESYDDPTTIVYIPYHFQVRDDFEGLSLDTVVHFHGHRTTAGDAMREHELREQLLDSEQNAILVMPQGPERASDSSGGNLDAQDGFLDFLTEVRKSVQQAEVSDALVAGGGRRITNQSRIGRVCLSGHSGAYRVISRCISRGGYNVNEVYLLDALYGEIDAFYNWVAERRQFELLRERHKLVSFWQGNGDTARNNQTLIDRFESNGIPHVVESGGERISRDAMIDFRAVFIDQNQSHQGVAVRENPLRDCLYASCLERYRATTWFDAREGERPVDTRD